MFYILNLQIFQGIKTEELFLVFIKGITFDLSAILTINIPFLLLFVLDIIFKKEYSNKKITRLSFIFTNCLFVLTMLIDIFWFKHTFKHSGINMFYLFKTNDNFFIIFCAIFKDYWLGFILFLGYIYIWYEIDFKIYTFDRYKIDLPKWFFFLFIPFLFFITIIGIRGGFQLRPISVANASVGKNSFNNQIVLNTPFCIIQNLVTPKISLLEYMPSEKAKSIIENNRHSPAEFSKIFKEKRKPNIIIIIVESLSKEYCGFLNNGIGFTPFLDSLSKESIVFTNFYANGKQSIEGIPALLSGIPALMDEPFITSIYADNKFNSIAKIVKPFGYYSSFYHGGKNGTMNFDSYTLNAGFDKYIGKNEYRGKPEDDDGFWGIYDEPFLSFVADNIKTSKKPYLDVIFTLSSHQPYQIPINHKNHFRKGKMPIHQTIFYVDYSINKFIEKLSKNNQIDSNTYIIITADHTGTSNNKNYNSRKSQYAIPLLIYNKSKTFKPQTINKTFQQIDLIRLFESAFKFNNFNLWSSNKYQNFSTNYFNNTWQIITDSSELEFNGKDLFHYESLNNKFPNTELTFLKAYIQLHNNNMINNKIYYGN